MQQETKEVIGMLGKPRKITKLDFIKKYGLTMPEIYRIYALLRKTTFDMRPL
jgi:hypothetical protein